MKAVVLTAFGGVDKSSSPNCPTLEWGRDRSRFALQTPASTPSTGGSAAAPLEVVSVYDGEEVCPVPKRP
jgi:hypothetical protein